jgi:hypothetical protein
MDDSGLVGPRRDSESFDLGETLDWLMLKVTLNLSYWRGLEVFRLCICFCFEFDGTTIDTSMEPAHL